MRIVIEIDTAMNHQKLKGRISFHCDQQSADMVCISSWNCILARNRQEMWNRQRTCSMFELILLNVNYLTLEAQLDNDKREVD